MISTKSLICDFVLNYTLFILRYNTLMKKNIDIDNFTLVLSYAALSMAHFYKYNDIRALGLDLL